MTDDDNTSRMSDREILELSGWTADGTLPGRTVMRLFAGALRLLDEKERLGQVAKRLTLAASRFTIATDYEQAMCVLCEEGTFHHLDIRNYQKPNTPHDDRCPFGLVPVPEFVDTDEHVTVYRGGHYRRGSKAANGWRRYDIEHGTWGDSPEGRIHACVDVALSVTCEQQARDYAFDADLCTTCKL